MIQVHTGKFGNRQSHHAGWFRVFRFGKNFEIWAGNRWIMIERGK